ncbi:MAG: metallophosphoesterase family protein [Thermoleophilia bacterium]|nr:metallophosphoesterase family protein [Thermoleophilia bacterium]
MRVAALHDVHGNLPALEAVLAELRSLDVDRIVCGGDVIAGPFPQESLDRLREVEAVFIRGNADRESPRAPEGTWEWLSAQLDEESREFLRTLPLSASLDGVLYCHGSPRDDDEILTKVSPDERFRDALAGVAERVVVGGHTHVQFERVVDGIRFVNAGSVGMPYEGRQGAFWALLDRGGPQHRHTPYAVDAAAALIRTSSYPGAEQMVGWLLEPEDPDEVSAYFESVAT